MERDPLRLFADRGAVNAPATQAATGYEVDKYSAREVRRYLDQYFGAVLPMHGLRAVLTDSYEAGQSNWTPAMIEEFRAAPRPTIRRPYLPVLAGHVVRRTRASRTGSSGISAARSLTSSRKTTTR